jgi:phosphoribosylglycinamide formyltransferase-1
MKIGILISGRGSNMSAIIEAVRSGFVPDSDVVIVVSDKMSAEGLKKAKDRNIETLSITQNGRMREEHDAEIVAALKKRDVELVCLAGYMRLLSKEFIQAFPERILNVHPSLLPSFKGLDAQRQAIEYGVKFSGCTVHFVDENLDHGAIIAQKIVEVENFDTTETLSARILLHEHALYVESIKRIVQGKIKIVGRTVIFLD